MSTSVVPVFRIFDYKKAVKFYVDWLGFIIEWEHKFSNESPIYLQISRDGIVLHLSEHHDCLPGLKSYITSDNVKAYHKEITDKNYKYNKLGLEKAPWNALCMEVIDPFSNKLLITEVAK